MSKREIAPILRANIAKEATVHTDAARLHWGIDKRFAGHAYVTHGAGEYGRGDVHTNTIEGYFSIFKRGMMGVYQHCGKKHLHRYVAEFDFRYRNRAAHGVSDADRALQSIIGKRLTYAQ